MSFLRDGQSARSWAVWLGRHRDTLVRCGLPDFLLTEERRWMGLLEGDGWDAETGWRVEWLPPDQAACLHQFVAREYGRERHKGLLRALETVKVKYKRNVTSRRFSPVK